MKDSLLFVLQKKKGGASMAWVASIPVFMVVFLFLATLATVMMDYSAANQAAEAGSIAATKKLDEWLLQDQNVQNGLDKIVPENTPLDDTTVGEQLNQMDKQLLAKIAEKMLEQREDEMRETVREYVQKNGGEPHGVIVFPVHDNHIHVEAKKDFHSMIFADFFKDEKIEGEGLGPEREYLSVFQDKQFKIEY
jgi:flagellar basal body-associated protein FliL